MFQFLRCIGLAVFGFMLCLAPAWAATLDGRYDGIADGEGMTLSLEELDGRVVGKLVMVGGEALALNGERSAKGAQGSLRIKGSDRDSAFFLLEERPRGVQLLIMPARDDGTPDAAAGRQYSLLRKGVGVAVPVAGATKTVPAPDKPVDVIDFIDGYRNWSPLDGARLYAGLDDQSRGLILLYDFASADMLWRLCEAEGSNVVPAPILSEALERQQVDCASYAAIAKKARQSELYPEFQRRARFQLELVRATVLCHRGQSSADKCNDVAALSTPLILRWRKAMAIMQEIASGHSQEGSDDVKSMLMPESQTPTTPQVPPASAATSNEKASGGSTQVPLARPNH